MIHPLAGENEIIHYLNEVNSRFAFIFDGTYKIIRDSIGKTSVQKAVVITAGDSLQPVMKTLFYLKTGRLRFTNDVFCTWRRFIAMGKGMKAGTFSKDINSVAIISHTGGTTGDPKGVMCSNLNINAMILQIGKVLSAVRQESQLAVLPPFINYSLVNAMLEPVALGVTTILIPNYDPLKFVSYAEKYKPTYISSIPPYWEALLKIKGIDAVNLSFLRCPFYGGEAMNNDTEEKVNRLLQRCGAPNSLAKGLGSTEMVSASTLTPYDFNIVGSAGIPLPKINCKIVTPETTDEESYEKVGEICFSGPTLMIGYYNNQKATDEIIRIHPDGQRWLHTGDLGYMDENGVLFVTGRIKRIFMTKGRDRQITKVFPDRIEAVLSKHPSVDICCAVAVPDEDRINYPKAFIVLKKGYEPSEKLTEEIRQCCRTELPEYMIPEKIEYAEDLPRTERRKIDYRALEEKARTS